MDIDITRFFREAAPMDYCASVAEIGWNASRDTWRAACDDAPDYADLLDTEDKRDAFRAFVKGFGAWDDAEIHAWDRRQLTALFMQFVAGDIREACLDDNPPEESVESMWQSYDERAHAGQCAGRIYRGDDGRVYFTLDS